MILALADIKALIGETTTDNDTILTDIIEEAQIVAESYIGRALESGSVTDFLDGNGESIVNLPSYPVSAMTSFQYNTGTISTPVWTAFDADTYSVKGDTGQIRLKGRVPRGFNNIKVVYVAGYTTDNVPKDIIRCLKDMVVYFWNTKDTGGINSETIDGSSVTFDSRKKPDMSLLDPYRSIYV